MNTPHARRVVALLENPVNAPPTPLVPFYLETTRWGSCTPPTHMCHGQLRWKWFLQEIGKQSCLLGLLPFIEVVSHLKNTPVVEGDDYRRLPEVELRLFNRKVALLLAWAQMPSRTVKRELISLLEPVPTRLGYNVFVVFNGGSPAQVAVAFLNWLVLIVVDKRRFHNYMFWAFKCLAQLGYPEWLTCRIFKESVARHYASQPEPPRLAE